MRFAFFEEPSSPIIHFDLHLFYAISSLYFLKIIKLAFKSWKLFHEFKDPWQIIVLKLWPIHSISNPQDFIQIRGIIFDLTVLLQLMFILVLNLLFGHFVKLQIFMLIFVDADHLKVFNLVIVGRITGETASA